MTSKAVSGPPDILPYAGESYLSAVARVSSHPLIAKIIARYFSIQGAESHLQDLRKVSDVDQFHQKLIAPLIDQILSQSSGGLTALGLDRIDPTRKYLFISNHRDIVADPALFTYALFCCGIPTPKICLGDNLLASTLIEDLVKMNKGLIVQRGVAGKALLLAARQLSEVIGAQIEDQVDSIWIAQREGRAKDGLDATQSSLLRMLFMAHPSPPIQAAAAFQISPVAISYEYDPCDLMKAQERVARARCGTYVKKPGEDTQSMVVGICEPKGRIRIQVAPPLNDLLADPELQGLPPKAQIQSLVQVLDCQIGALYHLWPTHYIAADLFRETTAYQDHYQAEELRFFSARLAQRLEVIPLADRPEVRTALLEAYANPVRAHETHLDEWGQAYRDALTATRGQQARPITLP